MLPDRGIVRVSGPEARGFLQGLVTNDIAGELPVWAGLLSPQGKCLFDFIVWPDEQGSADALLLDCEAEAADDLIKRLSVYRLRRPIAIERDPSLSVHWSRDGEQGTPDPRLPQLGRRWLGDSAAPTSAWLEHRLRLGVCEGRAELGDILWLECNAVELNGVSFRKGCFVGQENTARMNWRSKVNRRLVVAKALEPGKRTRVHYPALGLAVDHRRLDDLEDALIPEWLAESLKTSAEKTHETQE
jgi:folate-binding protein YgfZ